MTDDLRLLDATGLLDVMARGQVSAVDVIDFHLGLADPVNAIVDRDHVTARSAAAAIDERRAAGAHLGALAGLPLTAKSSFDVRGLRTTVGMLAGSHRATHDAPTVARLRAADAIVFGKTNVAPFLADYQSSNEDFGVTRNPWNADRTPGGSSGGSAAAIAAGLSAGELGSDLGGSIRMPAAWSGVFAHRPSHGVISKRGHLPWPTDTLLHPPQSTAGPLARSARDLELLFGVMAGGELSDERAWILALPASRAAGLAGLRVGLWLDDDAAPIDSETRAAIEAFALRLEHQGARVVELWNVPAAGQAALDLNDALVAVEIAAFADDATWQQALAAASGRPDDPVTKAARLLTQSGRDVTRALEAQRRVQRDWELVYDSVDIVVCPAVATTAPLLTSLPRAERTIDVDGTDIAADPTLGAWSALTNIARGPVTVVPVGLGASSGMPVGVQLLGAYLDDLTPLRVAVLAEQAGLLLAERPPLEPIRRRGGD